MTCIKYLKQIKESLENIDIEAAGIHAAKSELKTTCQLIDAMIEFEQKRRLGGK